MADRAQFHLDVDGELASLALDLAVMAEDAAELLASEIRAQIPDSPLPSAPGQPPNSPGPYRDSWHHTKAKRKGDSITAWAFSLASTDGGESLGEILEYDLGRPHVRPAEVKAQAAIEARVEAENRRLRGGS